MKILSAKQIRQADQFTIDREPIASIDLMERASAKFTEWFTQYYPQRGSVHVFCGTGNNGGDGLAISRMLISDGWTVFVYLVNPDANQSEEFKINYLKLNQILPIRAIKSPEDLDFKVEGKHKIIDAIFGSGLTREVTGIYSEVIEKINSSGAEVISVDVPTGLFTDKKTEVKKIVKADHIVTFQLPKLSFFLPENSEFVNHFHVVDIGLHPQFIAEQKTENFTIEKEALVGLFGKRPKHSYKNQFGHALVVAGSYGKMGAAVLTSRACLRCGVGLLTVHVPKCGYEIMQMSVPEAMVSVDSSSRFIQHLPELAPFATVGIGPGLDKDVYTVDVLAQLLDNFRKPVVIDADGLNLIAENKELVEKIPENSVLTPHAGEFKRLVGEWKDDFEKLEMQRTWSRKHKVILVLKGAHTSVSLPNGNIYFNTTGNPGMATGGSGDVLTGVITGLLAQGLSPENAALAGVYLHGTAGDLAKVYVNEICMVAGDIITFLPEAFNHLTQ